LIMLFSIDIPVPDLIGNSARLIALTFVQSTEPNVRRKHFEEFSSCLAQHFIQHQPSA
jgi:hypothetical protein